MLEHLNFLYSWVQKQIHWAWRNHPLQPGAGIISRKVTLLLSPQWPLPSHKGHRLSHSRRLPLCPSKIGGHVVDGWVVGGGVGDGGMQGCMSGQNEMCMRWHHMGIVRCTRRCESQSSLTRLPQLVARHVLTFMHVLSICDRSYVRFAKWDTQTACIVWLYTTMYYCPGLRKHI